MNMSFFHAQKKIQSTLAPGALASGHWTARVLTGSAVADARGCGSLPRPR